MPGIMVSSAMCLVAGIMVSSAWSRAKQYGISAAGVLRGGVMGTQSAR